MVKPMNKRELAKKCKHIIDYGENWGFEHVKGEIAWRKSSIRRQFKEIQDLKTELQAFQKLLINMSEKRILKELVVKQTTKRRSK